METNVGVEACKCACALSKSKLKFDCLAVEYFAEKRVCFLYRHGRAQNPRAFGKSLLDPSKHSYMDYLCVDNGNAWILESLKNEYENFQIMQNRLILLIHVQRTTHLKVISSF